MNDIAVFIANKITNGINKALKLGVEPMHLSDNSILKLYCAMYDNIDLYLSSKPYLSIIQKKAFKDWVYNSLEILEFEASWNVLKKFMDEGRIKTFSNPARKYNFLKNLYQNKGDFIYFNARFNTLQKLDYAKFLKSKDYIL